MSSSSGNNNNDNNENSLDQKLHRRIDVVENNKAWIEFIPPIQSVDVTNDEQWESRSNTLKALSNSVIENIIMARGSTNSSELRNDLQAYYDITERSAIAATLLRIYADPRIIAQKTYEARPNYYFVKYKRKEDYL
jgi:hypothetical protein